jgi:ABC-2 type transport system permease protein
MVVIAFTAVGFGLVLASKIEDFQGFQLIINLIIMPLLFLSSAFFPVPENSIFNKISLFNPLFYMVDGLRGSLIGTGNLFPPFIDLVVVIIICIIMLTLGSYFFSRSEV